MSEKVLQRESAEAAPAQGECEKKLVISRYVLAAVERHARLDFPRECCGALVGRESAGATRVDKAVTFANVADGDRSERYALDPEALLAVVKAARAEGRQVVGYYHSHPDGSCRPSTRDLDTAWPDTTYLIIGTDKAAARCSRAWRLAAGGGKFVEETLEIR